MYAFEYHRPGSTKDAIALAGQKPEGRYLAGGQSLVQAMKLRLSSPSDLIDLAAIGDLRAIRAGGLQGSRRLARHLWRMCFGLFIATGSFFLGQMKFIPEPVRILPLLFVLAFAPIPLLFYWLWRVRVRGRLSGIVLGGTSQSTL